METKVNSKTNGDRDCYRLKHIELPTHEYQDSHRDKDDARDGQDGVEADKQVEGDEQQHYQGHGQGHSYS